MKSGHKREIKMKDEVKHLMRQFDSETIRTRNCIKFDLKSKLEHKLKVIDICRNMLLLGQDFFTRARLRDGSACADVFQIGWASVIEVQDSETDESIERKKKVWAEHGFNSFDVVKI
jgi:hypothetical protein